MLDESVRTVLERLGREDEVGRFLFALVAPQTDCEVLEVGAGEGYATIWLADAARHLAGRVLSVEQDPALAAAWRENVAAAGLDATAQMLEGDPIEVVPSIDDVFDVVYLHAADEALFEVVRTKLEPGALVVAGGATEDYSQARRQDPTLVTVTVPLAGGIELTVILR